MLQHKNIQTENLAEDKKDITTRNIRIISSTTLKEGHTNQSQKDNVFTNKNNANDGKTVI